VQWFGKAGTFGLYLAYPMFLASHADMGSPTIWRAVAWTCAIPGLVLAWVVIVREVTISVATVALAAAGARRIDVQWAGKAGTLALMVAFPLFLGSHADNLGWEDIAGALAWIFVLPGLVLAWYAAITYIPRARVALAEGRVGATL
jgi:cardiolipin synthase